MNTSLPAHSAPPQDPALVHRNALAELVRVCQGMDHADQMQRPTEEEYLAALAQAEKALEGETSAHASRKPLDPLRWPIDRAL